MRSSITQVLPAIDVAKAVHSTVVINIVWATVYNALLIPLAMGFGRPFGLVLHPYVMAPVTVRFPTDPRVLSWRCTDADEFASTLAGALMIGSSLGVTYNSLRLKEKLEHVFESHAPTNDDPSDHYEAQPS